MTSSITSVLTLLCEPLDNSSGGALWEARAKSYLEYNSSPDQDQSVIFSRMEEWYNQLQDFSGGHVVKSHLPMGDMGSISGPGRSHMRRSS